MKTTIVDLSHYNETIEWDKAKEQLAFAILRASVGKNTDKRYLEYASECWKRAIPYHTYHYIKALTVDEAKYEASVFHAATASTKPLFYVVDCEYEAITEATKTSPGLAQSVVDTFIAELKRLVGKDIRVAVYIGHHCYKDWNLDYDSFAYVWIPRYGKNSGEPEKEPSYPCDIWQYTSKGRVDFVSDNVDLNKLLGDKPMEYFTDTDDKFTNLKLATWCLDVHDRKWRYWYGTCGYECTKALYERKKEQYPSHYGSSRTEGYMQDIADGAMCADCVGMIKAFFWKNGDIDSLENKYKSNNCPDKSANGMFAMCETKGPIGTMPDIPGLVVHKDGHIGVHVGGKVVVEMRGYATDSVKSDVSNNNWEEWGMLPASMLTYVGTEIEIPEYKLGDRVLRKGDEGNDVAELQTALAFLGYNLGTYGPNNDGADGTFGQKTETALKDFQSKCNLAVDGVFGAKTYKALTDALDPSQPPVEDTPDEGSEPDNSTHHVLVILGPIEELEAIKSEHGGEIVTFEESE